MHDLTLVSLFDGIGGFPLAFERAGNDDALVGVVVAKRRGTADPGRWWVHMTVDDLLALLTGQRHGHRKDYYDG